MQIYCWSNASVATVSIPQSESEIIAIRSQGAGGQNINRVATAIHLQFDIAASSLPQHYKEWLLQLNDRCITKEGVVAIEAQEHRSQERNRAEALSRLQDLIKSVGVQIKRRKLTRVTRSSVKKDLIAKASVRTSNP